jgi:hypothetical protein
MRAAFPGLVGDGGGAAGRFLDAPAHLLSLGGHLPAADTIGARVFSLAEGKTSKVVKSPYGFHLFKVLQKEKGRWIEFAEVKEKIKADLAKGKEEQDSEWLVRSSGAKSSMKSA